MAWMPRTWADDHPGRLAPPCQCGRGVPGDMLVRVDGVPAELRTGLPRRGPRPELEDGAGVPLYLCDGCRERIIRERGITRAQMAKHLGAPMAAIVKLQARERGGQ